MKRWVTGFSLFLVMFVLSACGLFGGSDDIRDGRGGRVPNQDITWHTVTFDSQGGSSIDAYLVAEGTGFILSQVPNRRGFTFTGWYEDATLSTPFAGAEGLYADVTVYAGWSANTYQIMFFVADTLVYSGAYTYEETLNYPETPHLTGRVFSHWEREGQVFNRSRMPDENVEVVAVFTLREYLIHFQTNVPQTVFDGFLLGDIPYTVDDLPTAPTSVPHIEGWTFVGFFKDSESDEPFDFSQPPLPDEDAIVTIEVRYEPDGS